MKRSSIQVLALAVFLGLTYFAVGQPSSPGGLLKVVHDGTLSGSGTNPNPLKLALCGSNQIYRMGSAGSAWACGADSSGATNGAPNHIIPVSDGTNFGSSHAADDGTNFFITSGGIFTVNESTGATTVGGVLTASANLISTAGTTTVGNFRGVIDSLSLAAGTTNNWIPTGYATSENFYVSCNAGACTLTGLQGGADGRHIRIVNTGSSMLSIPNASGLSSAGNQFNNSQYGGTVNLIGNSGCAVDYVFSTASNFWTETGFTCNPFADDGSVLTTGRGMTVGASSIQLAGNGNIVTSVGTIEGAIVTTSTLGVYMQGGGLNYGYITAGAATGYINNTSDSGGTGNFRSLEIDDGKGSGTSHALAFFDGANNGVTLGSGAATKITMSNQPVGGNGTPTGRHWENYEEFMLGGAAYPSGTPMDSWEYFNSGGTGYSEANAYDITGGGSATGRDGILALQYSASSPASGDTAIQMATVSFSDGNWSMDGAIAVSALSSSSSAIASLYGFWFGFHDGLSAATLPTTGCYFQYNGTVDASHLSCACATSSVRTTYTIAGSGNSDESFPLGTATVAANTYMNLLVKMTGTTRAEFFYNGTKVCDINTHVPGAAVVAPPRIVLSTAQATGTAARNLFIDWARVAVDYTSTRSP